MFSAHRLRSLSLAGLLVVLAGCGGGSGDAGQNGQGGGIAPPKATSVGHVFMLVLENKSYDRSFGPDSAAPYLAQTLPSMGVLLKNYYATGHASLDNYVSFVSGQAPNLQTQADCSIYLDFVKLGPLNANGQAIGTGCIYPASVPALQDQLRAAGLSWKGYMQDMGNDPTRYDPALSDASRPQGARTCGRPKVNSRDQTQSAAATDQYAARHNPFVYFHSVIDDQAYCDQHVVNLDDQFESDLKSIDTTPSYSFITPNLCDDGHDSNCANGDVGGLTGIDGFLAKWVPVILASPAFQKDGLLIVTYDESAGSDTEDNTACCGELGSLLTNSILPPGEQGPGGGRVGAVLLSPFIKPGTMSQNFYNHYSLLRSVERIFGLSYIGYAASGSAADGAGCDGSMQPCSLDADVFTQQLPAFPARPQS